MVYIHAYLQNWFSQHLLMYIYLIIVIETPALQKCVSINCTWRPRPRRQHQRTIGEQLLWHRSLPCQIIPITNYFVDIIFNNHACVLLPSWYHQVSYFHIDVDLTKIIESPTPALLCVFSDATGMVGTCGYIQDVGCELGRDVRLSQCVITEAFKSAWDTVYGAGVVQFRANNYYVVYNGWRLWLWKLCRSKTHDVTVIVDTCVSGTGSYLFINWFNWEI